MQVQPIRDLYRYDAWVNGVLLALAEQAPAAQTRIQLGGSFDSLHGTLAHVVNHGTHHRSELADMLTRLGLTVPPTDLLVYFDRIAATRVG